MFSVIQSGSQQLKVAEGEIVKIEKINGKVGDKVKIDNVLMLDDGKKTQIGTPTIKGASVTGEIIEQGKDRKIIVFKSKRRKKYKKKRGHRQLFTCLKITKIN